MLLVGSVFVTISGLMYFAFMAAWLNVFQLFGHLAWVTLAAGVLAVFVGVVNVKDFFWFEKGLSLSIPESKKPDIFRRASAILAAENLPAMLAAYNLIYVLPLAVIVAVFARTLDARKLTEREGRLLKLMSGLMLAAGAHAAGKPL